MNIERVDQIIVSRNGFVRMRGYRTPILGKVLNESWQWQALSSSDEIVGPVRRTRGQALDDLFRHLVDGGKS